MSLEHVRALNREVERLEQLARTRQVTLDWYRDQSDRWRAEKEAARQSQARAWRYFWFAVVVQLILFAVLAVLAVVRYA